MILTTRCKEAIKTALAMTIAYGIALSMAWDRPYWAGLAVAVVSLSSIGQSINKAAFRMFGTLVAMVVSLTIIALFAQQRWAFILFLTAYAGFCTYMMSGSKRAYFWQVSCFVAIIICIDGGTDPVNAFDTAILRAEQTGLGILVYSLIAIFLWPSSSRDLFNAATTDLACSQNQFYQACLGLAKGQGDEQEIQRLAAQVVQAKTRFDQLLDAAEIDSSEVWELRRPWRQYQRQDKELMQALERWRESLAEVQVLDLPRLLPKLETFAARLDGRLAQIARILGGDAPERAPQGMDLPFDRDALRSLSHFETAALVVSRSHMLQLEQLTRSLFETVSELKGFSTARASSSPSVRPTAAFLPDLDRLASVVRFIAIMGVVWLALIYVPGLPGGVGLLAFAGSVGIIIANTPQLPVSVLFMPCAISVLFAAIIYIFVMPKLSSFLGLGLLIFAVTFAICYLFAAPRQAPGKAVGLSLFVTMASISNEQSYNFLIVANTAMMFPLLFLVFGLTAYIPWSPRPERAFLRLLGRFFRSSEYLMSAMRWDGRHAPTRWERWKKAFHEREVATLPAKLATWAPQLDDWVLSTTSMEKAKALMTSLQVLSYRMERLLGECGSPQAQYLVEQLLEDFRAWRLGIQACFQQLATGPTAGERDKLRKGLDEEREHLEARMQDVVDKASREQVSNQEAENFYRLLGAYRALSEALVYYAGDAVAIDWAPWREERFA